MAELAAAIGLKSCVAKARTRPVPATGAEAQQALANRDP